MARKKPAKRRKKVTRKRRPSTRRTKKRKAKRKVKKKPFGGYNIAFEGCTETMEEVFGRKPIAPSEMTKILWRYIKKWHLGGKN